MVQIKHYLATHKIQNADTNRDIVNDSQNTPNAHATDNTSTNQALTNHQNVDVANQVGLLQYSPSASPAQNNNNSNANSTATEPAGEYK